MHKNIITTIQVIVLLAVCGHLCAGNELVTGVHWPLQGDRVTKTHYEFMDMPSDTAVWDFSRVIETGASHEMEWMVLGDTVLVRMEHGGQSTFMVKGDSVVWSRHEHPLLHLTDSVAPVVFGDGFPFSRDSIVSPYHYKGSYSGNHAVEATGNLIIRKFGTGTLILPDDTLQDIVRIRRVTDSFIRVGKDNSLPLANDDESHFRHIQTVDRWYSPCHRYELVENRTDRYMSENSVVKETNATFICSPRYQELMLQSLRGAQKSLGSPYAGNGQTGGGHGSMSLVDNVSVTCDANGVHVTVNRIESAPGDGGISVVLSDQLGRVWHSLTGHFADGGQWSGDIPTSGLPSGNYVLHVKNGEGYYSEKISVR